jgi:hypothetical protein
MKEKVSFIGRVRELESALAHTHTHRTGDML